MKLIEAEIEKVVLEQMQPAIQQISGVQVIGTWQATDETTLKGNEDKPKAVLVVKAFPRSYDTPTIPDAVFQVEVSLAVRTDIDFNGKTYLDITTLVSDVLQDWQNNFDSLSVFDVQGYFSVTGLNLTGGDCGLDRDNGVWQYSQGFSVYGIVEKHPQDNTQNEND